MFSLEERAGIRDALVTRAREDERITGAAVTGSAALNREDRWSESIWPYVSHRMTTWIG